MSEKLLKKNANLRREISHLHGKVNNLKNRLKLKEDEITDLKRQVKELKKEESKVEG